MFKLIPTVAKAADLATAAAIAPETAASASDVTLSTGGREARLARLRLLDPVNAFHIGTHSDRNLQSMMPAMMPLSTATPVTMVTAAATTRPAVPRSRTTLRLWLTATAMAPLTVSVRTVRGGYM